MAKRKRGETDATIRERLKEAEVKERVATSNRISPFKIFHREVEVIEFKGIKSRRVHHLLSDLEAKFFKILDLSPVVKDIREQFPLPQRETLIIAAHLGIKHPTDPKTQQAIVMTSDFVLTMRESEWGECDQVRSIKYSKDLASPRTVQKLELERQYWLTRNVEWAIITELDIPSALALNVELLHPFWSLEDWRINELDLTNATQALAEKILEEQLPLREIARSCDSRLGLIPGTSLTIAYHLTAVRYWQANWFEVIDPAKPLILNKGT